MIKSNGVKYWKTYLGLDDWDITTHEIDDKQVLYDKDIPEEDKYFIGVQYYSGTKQAVIYHARDLCDEDIVHELLHVKNPKWTEDEVNKETDNIISNEK